MPRSPHIQTCTKSLKLLADFWTLRIIDSLTEGEQRFCEVQRSVGNVNPATLTKKLYGLEHAKLIERREDTTNAVFYRLTPLGEHTLPVLRSINTFSKKFERGHS